ncbi:MULTISPECIES: GNAT family N-acetyltransferase [Sphingomonas]|uniref:GNAT family N-acetyltransferase n=1 Tax=Edaphosphingomonas fennica TaxID=114404 RepID=A0A2T4HJR9_9SPHN|nr:MULTISPECIES: GNAT family N-acetyltransferase [Sphingomonas]MDX3885931.1 GNAT family N-acetyltransferase [Sphingomonas sp.]PTD16044.1 GNAT family N-acetyltransferase [Sphingomonas fennica]
MTVTVRPAAPADVGEILRMIRALAAYERQPDAVRATEEMLADRLFGPGPQVFALIAEMDGRPVGLALWFLNFSTWTGRHGLYLEDLFVDPEARRAGIARALFRGLAEEARKRDCARIDWAVLDWNEDAKRFYRSIGGYHSTGWEPWRLDGPALAAMQEE